MKTLYIECKMGAAGDMLMAALYELLDEQQKSEFLGKMNSLLGDEIKVAAERKSVGGIAGAKISVLVHGHEEGHEHGHGHSNDVHGHEHHHEHHSYASIAGKIKTLPLPEDVRENAGAVYRLIGDAEAKVHDTTIGQIHFHEVGTLDALADVVGCCLLFSMIGAEKIICSPIHVGNGFVHCAHGILPVPAPATAEILKGIPYYTGEVDTELCTPTGAALLRHFVTEFASMPAMSVRACGIGHGTKELPALNAVRTFLGDMFDESSDKKNDMTGEVLGDRSESFSDQITDISCNIDDMTDKKSETRQSADCEPDCSDKVADISCNIDDMTGEALGYAMEVLLGAGALDVFYVPVQMKKNRPGILLHCLCKPEETEHFAELILRHTTTRGVRFQNMSRLTLTSETETVATPYGEIKKKISRGHGIEKSKYEFEDLRRIATAHDMSLQEITSALPRP